jgi:Flp pilus assembly protein TadD
MKSGNYARADELFALAIKNGCWMENCYQGVYDANLKIGNMGKAIAAYEQIARLKPKDAQTQANLAMLYFNNKDYAKARTLAESIKKQFPATATQIDNFLKLLPN